MVMALVGASHHEVSLKQLEVLARADDGLAPRLLAIHSDIAGAVVLSTCNRFEVYLDAHRIPSAVEATIAMVAEASGAPRATVADAMRVVVGPPVAHHLFSVASGLESMIVGEDEIAGQVRNALTTAQREHTTTASLERLLQGALATSKAVTNSTGLGAAGRSVVNSALDIVEQRHGTIAGKRVLILGTGSYASIALAALRRRGSTNVGVFSSSGRASQYARTHDVDPVELSELSAHLATADLVIACSGAPHYLIDRPLLSSVSPFRHEPLVVVDLALAPDVDPQVHDRPQIEVIDLETVHKAVAPEHSAAVREAEEIVRQAVAQLDLAESGRTADDAIVSLRMHVLGIVESELSRVRGRVDERTEAEVARALSRVAQELLHAPTVRARAFARSGELDEYRHAIHTLFGIELDVRD